MRKLIHLTEEKMECNIGSDNAKISVYEEVRRDFGISVCQYFASFFIRKRWK